MAVLSLFAASGLFATSGKAQTASVTTTTTTTTPAPTDDTQVLEKYVVTGSNIPQAADALSIPVAVYDFKVMQESGVAADTLDMLRKVAPNISGIGEENATTESNFTNSGADVLIKGLPTLVLIDGRRVPNDPATSQGGYEFVDLNMIPPAAIDRIEVEQDGASAIYGSDAVGGVINIILKKDYNGWEVGSHYGFSRNDGHYAERSAYIVGGVSTDKTSITVTGDYAQHDTIMFSQRPYTNPYYNTYTYPGSLEVYDNLSGSDNFYVLAPGLSAPPAGGNATIQQLVANGTYLPLTSTQALDHFNLANYQTLIGSLKRYSAVINMEHKIAGDSLVGFGNAMFVNTKTLSQLNAQPLVPYLEDAWVDVNVLGYPSSPPPAGTSIVPSGAPGNPFSSAFLDQNQSQAESHPGYGDGSGEEILVRQRYLQFPRQYINDDTLFRGVGGLRGDVSSDLHWEIAANIGRYEDAYTNPGLWDTNALIAAWADGQINPFAVTQPASNFTGVVGTAFVNETSTLNSFDAKVDGSLFDLPAGKLGFAVGVEYVREGLSATPDINSLPNTAGTTQGWDNATTFQNFEATRDFISYFGELSLPVTSAKQEIPGAHAINIDGAVRYDDYSGDVGASTDPQVTLSWEPFDDQLKFRGSAGKSFIAPTLYSLYGPVSSGSTDDITYTTSSGGTKSAQFNQTGGSNPDLKPTTAKSWATGVVYTPKFASGLSISVDYSQIKMKAIIGTVPANSIIQSVELLGTASPYVSEVHFNTPTGPEVTGPGGISSRSPQSVYVIANNLNLSGVNVNSTDIVIDYAKKIAGIGKFDITSSWTWYNSYEEELVPTEPFYQYAGYASTNAGTVPKWKSYTQLDWSNSGLDVFAGVTYVESVEDIGVGGDNQYGFEGVSSFTAFDLGLTYNFNHLHASKWLDGLKVTIGCNNVGNKMPPIAPNAFGGQTTADVGSYDGAVGRMFYIDAKYSF
jgi:iron complex outermembrane receptor protein